MCGDVADRAHHRAVADLIRERFGGADIYMANAGVNTITPSGEVREAEYDTQFGINARGTFFGVQAIAPHLQERASIILVGSLASDKVLDGHAVYAGDRKSVVLGKSVSVRVDLGGRRIIKKKKNK